jgi:hypothetical protein
MKYFLILSLLLNVWYQCRQNIFEVYVDYHYCKGQPNSSYQFSEYDILGIHLFHINYIVSPQDNRSTVTCKDGTGNGE